MYEHIDTFIYANNCREIRVEEIERSVTFEEEMAFRRIPTEVKRQEPEVRQLTNFVGRTYCTSRVTRGDGAVEHKRMVIQNSHGEKLVGILHETGSQKLVIICHGFRSFKDRIPMVNLTAAFAKEGISAYRFDFAGNGESEGSFQYGNYRREADDLRAVVNHFHGEERCVMAAIGHSKGGNAVLLYASRYNDIPTIVNIAGRYNLQRGIEGRLGKDFREKIEENGFIDVKNRRVFEMTEGH